MSSVGVYGLRRYGVRDIDCSLRVCGPWGVSRGFRFVSRLFGYYTVRPVDTVPIPSVVVEPNSRRLTAYLNRGRACEPINPRWPSAAVQTPFAPWAAPDASGGHTCAERAVPGSSS
jgi:hypothetical protein